MRQLCAPTLPSLFSQVCSHVYYRSPGAPHKIQFTWLEKHFFLWIFLDPASQKLNASLYFYVNKMYCSICNHSACPICMGIFMRDIDAYLHRGIRCKTHSRQSARLSLQSSELAPPPHLWFQWGEREDTLARRRGGRGSQFGRRDRHTGTPGIVCIIPLWL